MSGGVFNLIALVAILYFVLRIWGFMYSRRRRRQSLEPEQTGFTVGELLQLRNHGMLSAEELEKAKASVINHQGRMQGSSGIGEPPPFAKRGFEVIPKKPEEPPKG